MENNYELIGEDKHRSPIYFVPDIEDIRVGYECESAKARVKRLGSNLDNYNRHKHIQIYL